MCGIVGIVGVTAVNQRIYDALTVLQHRGQDAAGIMTARSRRTVHAQGFRAGARCVSTETHAQAQGQCRHRSCPLPHRGRRQRQRCPAVLCQLALWHLPRPQRQFDQCPRTHRSAGTRGPTASEHGFRFGSAAECLASELQRVGTPRVTAADIFAAANAVYRRCRGGYAVVAMVIGHGLLGFRDPNGIRPLVIGNRETNKGTEWMLASESVALDMLGFKMVRDVAPARRCSSTSRAASTRSSAWPWYGTRPAYSNTCIRTSRLDHRQYLGLQGAVAHGRGARREDQARPPRPRHRCGHSHSRYQPYRRGPSRPAARRQIPGMASSRTAISAGLSSCRDRSSDPSPYAAS